MAHSDLAPATVEGDSQATDRRSCRRFPAAELKVAIKTKSGFFNSDWEDIHATDYNKKGLALITDKNFENEQPLTLRITLIMEMGNLYVDEVRAVAKNQYAEKEHTNIGKNRVGVAFDYTANRHMKSLDTQSQLGRIEGILERSENLRLKLASQ